jgi:hypothetical protein
MSLQRPSRHAERLGHRRELDAPGLGLEQRFEKRGRSGDVLTAGFELAREPTILLAAEDAPPRIAPELDGAPSSRERARSRVPPVTLASSSRRCASGDARTVYSTRKLSGRGP